MSDNMNDVLQELSALLLRISEQNDASFKGQEEFKSKVQYKTDVRSTFQDEGDQRKERLRAQMEELRLSAQKHQEIGDRRRDEDVQFRERLLQMLQHHNDLLESLIARLKENPKKG